jgi:hypothetical protein
LNCEAHLFFHVCVLKQEISQKQAFAVMANTSLSGSQAPKIVKTTTKQTIVQNADGLRHNKEEKVEDLTPGGSGAVTVVSSVNKVLNIFFNTLNSFDIQEVILKDV